MPPSLSRFDRGCDYVELRCRSTFSFLDGASNPEDLATRAAELGHGALALADRDGLYGAPRFHQAARAAGVRPLVGTVVSLATGSELLLLVTSQRDYRSLSRLVTLGQHARLAPAELDRARGVFPKRLWVDVARHPERRSAWATRRAVDLAEAQGVPLVASGDVRYARPEDCRLHDRFACLRAKTTLDRAGRVLAPNGERYLRTPAAMAARFPTVSVAASPQGNLSHHL